MFYTWSGVFWAYLQLLKQLWKWHSMTSLMVPPPLWKIQVCKNFPGFQKLFRFTKSFQVFKNFPGLQKLSRWQCYLATLICGPLAGVGCLLKMKSLPFLAAQEQSKQRDQPHCCLQCHNLGMWQCHNLGMWQCHNVGIVWQCHMSNVQCPW